MILENNQLFIFLHNSCQLPAFDPSSSPTIQPFLFYLHVLLYLSLDIIHQTLSYIYPNFQLIKQNKGIENLGFLPVRESIKVDNKRRSVYLPRTFLLKGSLTVYSRMTRCLEMNTFLRTVLEKFGGKCISTCLESVHQ